MEINIKNKNEFLKILQCNETLGGKTALPILENILFETEKDKLKIFRTNMEVFTLSNINVEVINEGITTIPLKNLVNIITLLPNNVDINIKVKNDNTILSCGKTKYNINGISADEYPKIPEQKYEKLLDCKINDFTNILNSVMYAVSSQETRYVLNGVLFKTTKDFIIAVATDGRRLSYKSIKNESANTDKNIIVPINALNNIFRCISNLNIKKEDIIKISNSDNCIKFEFDNFTIISRLIEGKFPDYDSIMKHKEEEMNKVVIDKENLSLLTKRALVCFNDVYSPLVFKIEGNKLNIEINSKIVSYNDCIDIKNSCNNIKFAINPLYLMNTINSIHSKDILIFIKNENVPIIIKELDNNDNIHLIMPVRV